jgi:hypothetical protein
METLLPAAVVRQVDLLCDEFERRWQQGARPGIEEFLARMPGPAGDVLREELLAVELECRCRAGEAPQAPEYAARLGVPAGVVERLLQEVQGASELDSGRAADTAGRPGDSTGTGPIAGPDADALPRVFAEYELLEKLGQGGMGTVYKARHLRLGKLVAVKLVRPDLRRADQALARFRREMQAVGRVEHPHLVEAQHAGEHDGVLYLVMKLVGGIDLARLAKQVGPLRVADACDLARQAALGLQHVHECGLVHRNIKPSNLVLAPAGVGRELPGADSGPLVKILDLGIARLAAEQAEGPALTGEGVGLGTADYMAPEQAVGAARVDIRADLYSLGCTLFHLLAGRPPFGDRRGTTAKLLAHQQALAPPLRSLRPDVPAELAGLVERLVAKRPEDRFAEPREVAEALAPLAAGADLAALLHPAPAAGPGAAQAATTVSAALTHTDRPRLRRLGRRRWALVGAASAAVLPAAVLTAVLVGRWAGPDGELSTNQPAPVAPEGKTAALAVRSLSVRHWADGPTGMVPRGDIGERSFSARFNDQVQVSAALSKPAYCYLLAFNADGTEQLCLPEDPNVPPPFRQRLEFPPGADRAFTLNDGVGVQAFVLVASRQPLPAYAAWKEGRPKLTWPVLRPVPEVVWRGDGQRVYPVTPGGEQRGDVTALRGVPPLEGLCRELRSGPGVEAVSALAFPVLPRQ